ncbi:GNAT family N-acetyltransferase [uncultured Roseibium sp.]|uniref:GNAT family N-acetyltransferase n=1 Tax=uncultured Roseibium sp. TaxID=1936171 RepID=UPI0026153545|nr:GNAT family N-acetyltransferase [uncultured Roseibium sp.]
MAYVEISFVEEADAKAVTATIEDRLLHALAEENEQSNNESFVLKATDETGKILGGLSASTSYDWLLIKLLWVDDKVRGAGLGRRLVQLAEHEAQRLGCNAAWLDTSNEAAHRFYLGLGYEDFGVLANPPNRRLSSHRRWFMKKDL